MIHTADTTARALYDVMIRAASEPREDSERVEFKHVRMRLVVLHKNLRATAEKVLKNWAAFGGGQRPTKEKPVKPSWNAHTLRAYMYALEDGDNATAKEYAAKLGGFTVDTPKNGATTFVAPVPLENERMPGLVSALRDDGAWIVLHRETGIAINRSSAKTRATAERKAMLEIMRQTPEAMANANARIAQLTAPKKTQTPTAYTIVTRNTAPDARSVAAVVAQVRHIDISGAAPAAHACKPAHDAITRRHSARKRQIQRAIAGQLAPHLVANLERCGLIRNGQATRKGRFLYLDDATI